MGHWFSDRHAVWMFHGCTSFNGQDISRSMDVHNGLVTGHDDHEGHVPWLYVVQPRSVAMEHWFSDRHEYDVQWLYVVQRRYISLEHKIRDRP